MNDWKTIEDVQKDISDEESARKYLFDLRWGKFASCPFCGNQKAYFIEKGKRLKCANPNCYKKFSVTTKTIMEASNIPLNKIVELFFYYAKTRGRCSTFEVTTNIDISLKTEFYVRDKMDFAFKHIDKVGKSTPELMSEIINAWFRLYEQYQYTKHNKFSKNRFHISEIDNIADPNQYNQLLRFARYFKDVYCHWIWIKDFATEQDILAETFLWMKDNGKKEYNAETMVRYIQQTTSRLWRKFLLEHPMHNEKPRLLMQKVDKNKSMFLKDGYVIKAMQGTKQYNGMSAKDIRKIDGAIDRKRKEMILFRQRNKKLHGFHSHFS